MTLNRLPNINDELIKYINLNKNNEIYIFGADIAGKVVQQIFKKNNIFINGYLDNNLNKCKDRIDDTEVFHSSYLNKIDRSSAILVASTYVSDIVQQLENYGFMKWALIFDILNSFNSSKYSDLITGDLQLNYSGGKFTDHFVNFAVANMVESQKKYLDESCLYIRSVDLIVTEKCSLKCKDCSNLMQYYEKPVNIGPSELLQDLEDLNTVSDEINEIRIIGGEPMMNKDFHLICEAAAKFKKFNKVVIYTNGTICPSDEKLKLLVNDKTFVFITTYGNLSKNAEKLASRLESLNINFNKQPAYGWTDSGKIMNYRRTETRNKKLFQFCCAKHFATYTDGKMFRCPFSANVERLNAISETPFDYFDIRNMLKLNSDNLEVKNKLKWFLREKDFLSACNLCNGRSYGQVEIEPGIQTKKTIQYVKHLR